MPAQTTISAPIIDLPATADRLGVNHRYVRRLVAERRIPFIKVRTPDPVRPGRGRRVGGRSPASPGLLTARYPCSRVAGPLLGRAFHPDYRLNPPRGSWQDGATQDLCKCAATRLGTLAGRVRDPLSGQMVALGTFGTKADADRAAALAMADQTRGAWVDPDRGRRTVADYAWAWLAERPKLRPRTRELYEGLLRLHVLPTLGSVELRKLSPAVVRRWYSGLVKVGKPGPSTVAKSYRLLHTILATATADELIVKNPCVIAGAGIERSPEREVVTSTRSGHWPT